MRLNEGEIGQTYRVGSVVVDEAITRRLEALGVNETTPVTILNKKGSGSVIFKVRGTRLAVGKRISDGILIEEQAVCGGSGRSAVSRSSDGTKERGGLHGRESK